MYGKITLLWKIAVEQLSHKSIWKMATCNSFANNGESDDKSDVEEADVVLSACGEVGIPESDHVHPKSKAYN